VEFHLFGPVELRTSAGRADLGTPREHHVVAVLAAEAGRLVPVGTLIERVWGPDAPPGARATLRVYLAHIRKVLDKANSDTDRPATLVRRPGGYLLEVDADQVDLHRFRRLVAQAREPGRTDDQRATLLHRALDLPTGEPLADLSGGWAERTRLAMSREYLDATLLWAGATLAAGRGDAAIGRLAELADQHTLNESLAAALMRALHAAGRGSEALKLYSDTQARLADELGTDPGAELQAVHQEILRGKPVPAPAAAVPAQLPADPASFAGRAPYLDQLDALTAGVVAIDGTAGVGKTALAVHWAHRVRDRYPDGQLYVNLRGFDPSGQVMDPATALRGFLDALGVPAQRVPTDRDAQAALYRSQLAGKRVLILLDNARDTAQVRPLLPGTPGCLVLVTSRNQLTSLIAAHDAHPVTLDLLAPDEAHALLARRLGAARVTAEPDAAHEIIDRCARLPLALTLVAAHAALRPRADLHALAGQLRDAQQRWQTLTGDDPSTDVRTVLSWSYQALSPDAARLFRLLGLHPGPDLTAPAAASLAAHTLDQTRPLLAELTRANLIQEPTPGRYTQHDLLRAYAAELATHDDARAATHRILDHYLHTAHTAARLLDANRDPLPLSPPQPGVTAEHLTDHQQALDWFDAEQAVLVAAVDHATAQGFDSHTWQLAWTPMTFLYRRGHWQDMLTIGTAAVAATQRQGERTAEANAHRNLAYAHIRLGRPDDAHAELTRALDLYRQAGDRTGQGHVEVNLALLWERREDNAQALDHARQALRLYQSVGHRSGEAQAYNAVGWYHVMLGDHEAALAACQQALALHQDLDDRDGQANTWDSLGYAHHHLGHHAEAIDCFRQALALFRELGERFNEATILGHLADSQRAAGDLDAARDTYRLALAIFDDLGHPNAEAIRAELRGLA
jgi:DNA-binding SARP family transcriptional activator/Tfp pilus assembly protein PilF